MFIMAEIRYQNIKWILTRSDNRKGQKPFGVALHTYERVFASSLYQQGIINRSWVFVLPITGTGELRFGTGAAETTGKFGKQLRTGTTMATSS